MRTVVAHYPLLRMRIAGLALVACVIALVLAGCSGENITRDQTIKMQGFTNRSAVGMMEADTSFIMIGDTVSVSVWGYPEFNTRAIVKINGSISLPLIGERVAAGLKKADLQQQLREKLSEYIKGEVKITLDIERPQARITVLGAVARPGSFPASTDVPLMEVFANVGGWTELSDLRYVRVNRASTATLDAGTIEINLLWLMDHGGTRGIPMVRPGDVVVVPRQQNFVREVSEFLRDALLLLGVFRIFN